MSKQEIPSKESRAQELRHLAGLSTLKPTIAVKYYLRRLSTSKPLQVFLTVCVKLYRQTLWLAVLGIMFLADITNRRSGRPSSPSALSTSTGLEQECSREDPSQDSRVTITESGARIINKRKIKPTNLAESAGPVDSKVPPAGTEGNLRATPTNLIFGLLKSLLAQLCGWLIINSRHPASPAATSLRELGEAVLESSLCRRALRNREFYHGDWPQAVELLSRRDSVDWRLTFTVWIKSRCSLSDIVAIIQVELQDKQTLKETPGRLPIFLRLAMHAATALPQADAREVLGIAMSLTRKQVNPYSSNGEILVSRATVVALLEQRPELDDDVFKSLELQSGSHELAAENFIPPEARLLAIALRTRAATSGTSLIRAASSAGFNEAQLKQLAKISDSTLIRPPRVYDSEATRPARSAVGVLARRIAPWLAGPVFTAGFAYLSGILHWPKIATQVGLGDSVALLALLVTANVFTVQMSASRLPGVVARSAGQSWQLSLSYSAAFTLLVLVFLRNLPFLPESVANWAAMFVLVLNVGSLLSAMFLLFRRTDAGRAAAGFVVAEIANTRRAARRLGKFQARSVALRDALATVPSVKTLTDFPVGQEREDIIARKKGFLLPSRFGLRRLLLDPSFANGVKLRIIAGLGTIVNSGISVAALMPGRDQPVNPRLLKRATKLFQGHRSADIEAVTVGAVALTQLALDLAKSGDFGTARTVAQQVVTLLTQHTITARKSRLKVFKRLAHRAAVINTSRLRADAIEAEANLRSRDTNLVPVDPALGTVISMAVKAHVAREVGRFDVTESLIVPLLSSSLEAESTVSLLFYSLPSSATTKPDSVLAATELLRITGIRALELRSRFVFAEVLDKLGESAQEAPVRVRCADTISYLGAAACRFDPDWAIQAVDRLVDIAETTGQNSTNEARLLVHWLWRIGAAGLVAGSRSVSVSVVAHLHNREMLPILNQAASIEDLLSHEAMRSNIRGVYLGEEAMDALANFATFATQVATLLSPASGGTTGTTAS